MVTQKKNKLHAFSYLGGKFMLVAMLIGFVPPHTTYCEVFGGSASFLLNKKPSKVEVYNDINSDVVNFFRTLRNKPEELLKVLKLTPYARAEFYASRNYIAFEKCDVEKARKFFVKHQQGFAGRGNTYGFAIGKNQALTFANKVDNLKFIAERLRSVQFENKDYEFMLTHYCKNNDVFAYLDPPYMHETRTKSDDYDFELDDDDHERMLQLAVKSPAKILISGYGNKLYDKYLKGWHKKKIDVACSSAYAPGQTEKPRRTEVLWWNYDKPKA